jgi:CRP/FNR family cyclic AMP-dependent transcriptional regulator
VPSWRLLVKLSTLGVRSGGSVEVPFKLTHEMMAQMIGTTRSRATSFLNRFRESGLVEYGPPFIIRVPALMARALDLPSLPFGTYT